MWFKRKNKSKTMFANVAPSQKLPLKIADVLKTACPAFMQTKKYNGYGAVWHNCYCKHQPIINGFLSVGMSYNYCTCVWQRCKTCNYQTFDELDFLPENEPFNIIGADVSLASNNAIQESIPLISPATSSEKNMTFTYQVYVDKTKKEK